MTRIINSEILDSGGSGIKVRYKTGDEPTHIQDTLVDGSASHGIDIGPYELDVVKILGMPESTNRMALIEVLQAANKAGSDDERKSLLDPQGKLMQSLNLGNATSNFVSTLFSAATNPRIIAWLSQFS